MRGYATSCPWLPGSDEVDGVAEVRAFSPSRRHVATTAGGSASRPSFDAGGAANGQATRRCVRSAASVRLNLQLLRLTPACAGMLTWFSRVARAHRRDVRGIGR
jgi:hypothetical protein